jgi:hypothetical protein
MTNHKFVQNMQIAIKTLQQVNFDLDQAINLLLNKDFINNELRQQVGERAINKLKHVDSIKKTIDYMNKRNDRLYNQQGY